MADDSALISALRTSRKVDDIAERLKEGSLEARFGRIAEAMLDPEWSAGPATLIATYPHHAVADKNGVIMKVGIKESDEGIEFGKVEVFDIPTSVTDLGQEVMETALAAVDHILDEDFEGATPMIASIANALSVQGSRKSQIETEIAKRGVTRQAWWHSVVAARMEGVEVPLPKPREGGDQLEDLGGSCSDLAEHLAEAAASVAESLKTFDENDATPKEIVDLARDVVEDLKDSIHALATADRENADELAGVFEGVGSVAGHLLLGVQFLKSLAEQEQKSEAA